MINSDDVYYIVDVFQILIYLITIRLKSLILTNRGQPNTKNEQSSEEENPRLR